MAKRYFDLSRAYVAAVVLTAFAVDFWGVLQRRMLVESNSSYHANSQIVGRTSGSHAKYFTVGAKSDQKWRT